MIAVFAIEGMASAAESTSKPIAGKVLFERECVRCHAADDSARSVGPNLDGVVGRRVATASGYQYSAALRTSNFVWSEENLIKYINNPNAAIPCRPLRIRAVTMCPGIHMSFQGLRNIRATMAVVNYLKTAGSQQQTIPTE
jgi:cytochrome c